MTQRASPIIVGLLLAWGGTALLVNPAAPFVAAQSSIPAAIVAQVALWLLFGAVIGIVVLWEKRPLGSLWLRPFQWQSVGWACLLALFTLLVMFPLTEWIRRNVGLSDYTIGMDTALAYPTWLRVVAVLTAGVVEETLFRGFAVTRLLQLGANVPLAITACSAVFAVLHWPLWGGGPVLAFFIGGLATTAFFVWRKDLLAMILGHTVVDMWALVIAGPSRWWD